MSNVDEYGLEIDVIDFTDGPTVEEWEAEQLKRAREWDWLQEKRALELALDDANCSSDEIYAKALADLEALDFPF